MLQKEHVEVYLSYSLAKEIISIDNYDSSKSKGGIFSLRFPQTLNQLTGRKEETARNWFNRQNIWELGWEGFERHLNEKAALEKKIEKAKKEEPIDDDISDEEEEDEDEFDRMLEESQGLKRPNKDFFKPIQPRVDIRDCDLDDFLNDFNSSMQDSNSKTRTLKEPSNQSPPKQNLIQDRNQTQTQTISKFSITNEDLPAILECTDEDHSQSKHKSSSRAKTTNFRVPLPIQTPLKKYGKVNIAPGAMEEEPIPSLSQNSSNWEEQFTQDLMTQKKVDKEINQNSRHAASQILSQSQRKANIGFNFLAGDQTKTV